LYNTLLLYITGPSRVCSCPMWRHAAKCSRITATAAAWPSRRPAACPTPWRAWSPMFPSAATTAQWAQTNEDPCPKPFLRHRQPNARNLPTTRWSAHRICSVCWSRIASSLWLRNRLAVSRCRRPVSQPPRGLSPSSRTTSRDQVPATAAAMGVPVAPPRWQCRVATSRRRWCLVDRGFAIARLPLVLAPM